MGFAVARDGVKLHWEETGDGTPILFIHEFAGDHRSWEPQVRHFARDYRCLTYNARGYPPSEVPEDPESYSQSQAVADAVAVLDAASVRRGHVVGLSMGGFCALHLGLSHPARALSLVVAGCGYGSEPHRTESFAAETRSTATAFEADGAEATANRYALGPARVQFENKDPRGWEEFRQRLSGHSAAGSAMTLRGIQARRPSLYGLRDQLSKLTVPTLVITGDEDEGCLEPDLMLKRTIPSAGLAVFPKTGHTCNLEEPELFNRTVQDFLHAVEHGRWGLRDPRSLAASLTGMEPGPVSVPGS